MIRPQKRNKKKRKPIKPSDISTSSAILEDTQITEGSLIQITLLSLFPSTNLIYRHRSK